MYTKRRRWQWGVGLALVGIGAVVTALLARPEPLLLSRAVSTERTIKLPYYWLTGQELLILGNRGGGYHSAHPMRYNVASKTTTELPLLKDVLDTFRIDDKRMKISPDGHRLLLRAGGRDSYVVRIDGTDIHAWDCVLPQQSVAWDPGGQYWLTFVGPTSYSSLDVNASQKCTRVLVHDTAGPCQIVHWQIGKVNRPVALHQVEDRLNHQREASTRSWPLSAQSPLVAGECNLTEAALPAQDRLLVMVAPPSSDFKPRTFFAPADIYEVNLRTGGMGARRRTGFRSPGGRVEEQVLSPRGDRQAWLVMNPNLPTGPAWLQKLWRLAGRRQSPQLEIWTSDLQGEERHEVGYVSLTHPGPSLPNPALLKYASGSPFPMLAPGEIHDLRWLPDGKHLSFLYHDLLYTMSAD